MMKKSFLAVCLMAIVGGMMTSCGNDDTNEYDGYKVVTDDDDDNGDEDSTVVAPDTLSVAIDWDGSSVQLSGDVDSISYKCTGGDVEITSNIDRFLELTLSGTTSDGSLLVNSLKKYGMILNGVSITNPDGAAINNQCGKSLFLTLADGTVNTLTDGELYAAQDYDEKGTLFSEGQIYFGGTGSLTINGKGKNGVACDDYIVVNGGTIKIDVDDTGANGIKVNDGFTINDGVLTIDVKADAARGIRCEARTTIAGGVTTITTSGDCETESIDGVEDASSAAGIKCDSLFLMTAGTLTITSKGDGGKGINCADTVKFEGGTLYAETKGGNDEGKPKAVKGDKGIIVCGGSFTAKCVKSWALDNGVDTEEARERVTIIGEPTTNIVQKRNVVIKYE